jgi:hypothetical protein
LTKNV